MQNEVYERLMKETTGGMFAELLKVPADFHGETKEHYEARLLAWEAAGKPETGIFWRARVWESDYCTQNGGDCSTCSQVNYGMDCHNNPLMPQE